MTGDGENASLRYRILICHGFRSFSWRLERKVLIVGRSSLVAPRLYIDAETMRPTERCGS